MSDQANYEWQKSVHEQQIRAAERAHDRDMQIHDMFNHNADRHAQAVIRIILILNGSAAIALLAFVGNLASHPTDQSIHVGEITHQIHWFVLGVISSSLAAILAYATTFVYAGSVLLRLHDWQPPFTHETTKSRWWRYAGWTLHFIAIACAVAGLVFFVVGVSRLHRALTF